MEKRMDKRMETTTVIQGLYRDSGKETGKYYSYIGLYRDVEHEMETTLVI